jgi:hypothetical protein
MDFIVWLRLIVSKQVCAFISSRDLYLPPLLQWKYQGLLDPSLYAKKKRCACAWGERREHGDHDFRVLAHAESVTFLLSISRCGITRPCPRGGGAAAPGPKRLRAPAGFFSIVLGHISWELLFDTFSVSEHIDAWRNRAWAGPLAQSLQIFPVRFCLIIIDLKKCSDFQ